MAVAASGFAFGCDPTGRAVIFFMGPPAWDERPSGLELAGRQSNRGPSWIFSIQSKIFIFLGRFFLTGEQSDCHRL